MMPDDYRFLKAIYLKAEKHSKRRVTRRNILLCAIGLVLLGIGALYVQDVIVRYGLIGALALSVFCAADWLWQGYAINRTMGDVL